MTREETKGAIRIMQAYVDGKRIEMDLYGDGSWIESPSPIWDWENYDYRIAPDQVLIYK